MLTRTAAQHERAWRELFDPVLQQRGDARPFTHDDYLRFIDGKPRLDGLTAFLASRGVELPPEQAQALADQKNRTFLQLLEHDGVEVFDDAVPQLRMWRAHGLGIAFVSASKNAQRVLRAAGLAELPDVALDGLTAQERGLQGKTELFLEAARMLQVEPAKALVVEDAVAGVEAATRAGFGLVVGVSRTGETAMLLEHGADRVVRALTDLGDTVEPGTLRSSQLPAALPFGEVAIRLNHRQPALLLDFDGTLTPIVPHPDQAHLTETARSVLRVVSQRVRTAVVSGRDRVDVEKRVGVQGLWYAGSHGFDIRGPQGEAFTPFESSGGAVELAELDRAEAQVRRELGQVPGIVVERKRFGLAVHYRMASEADAARISRLVRGLGQQAPHLSAHTGECVIELRPDVDWDKGRAVEYLLRLWRLDDAEEIPMFFGDGRTDEDAFRALREQGLGVLVGGPPRPTLARLRLGNPQEMIAFLQALCKWLDESEGEAIWSLLWNDWNPEQQRLREALCTLGNGYFATRGAAEEAHANRVHYPATYLAGGYDRATTAMHGQLVENEDLVNWPNWLPLTFRPEGGEWHTLEDCDVLEFSQELDLRDGELRRRVRFKDHAGRESVLTTQRIVSMDDPHVGGIRWELLPCNWSGPVHIRSSLDGGVRNTGVDRYSALRTEHLVPEQVGHGGRTMWLVTRTRQSRLRAALAARTTLIGEGADEATRTIDERADRVDLTFEIEAVQDSPLVVEKLVTLHTSRDHASSEPLSDALQRVSHLADYHHLATAHSRHWHSLWRRCDIWLEGAQASTNRILNAHIFHLLQVASPHIVDRDVGVPARGLHGEAYRGHVFWDELFMFPFLTYSFPQLNRALLLYRYRRLDAARWYARALGRQGACYPWQSGSSGREENQTWHLNPRSGRWLPDETQLQRHVNAAVAWNVWQYYHVTGDYDFLSDYGAEMLIEIARFWASCASWDPDLARYRIRGVVGPDEFHTHMPGVTQAGLDDNAYTNVMAAWCLRCAESALCEVSAQRRRELMDELEVSDEARVHWGQVASQLRVVFHDEHIISQFDGYANLRELDWDGYRRRYGDIHRLDRILEAEGESINAYKASKQADVLMLFFLFSADGLIEQLHSMGYPFESGWIADNIDYYLRRTSHGSTLSRVVHAWVLARSDRAHSFHLFQEALQSDVEDTQGGTTAEGIHLGAMAGTVDLAKRAYTGAVARDGVLWLEPHLPDEVPELRTRFWVRDACLDVRVTHEAVEVQYTEGRPPQARIGMQGRIREVARGHWVRIDAKSGASLTPG